MPSGRIVIFNGYFDNAAQISAELGADPGDLAALYGLAVERWNDDADRRIIGDYCAVVADPKSSTLRLSRSPLRAPPLYYYQDDQLTATASVPRALFAAGVEQRLNRTRITDHLMRNFSDDEASPFEAISQVPTGAIVELASCRPRRLKRWYSLADLPPVEVPDDAAAIARVEELLDEGVRCCIAGFKRPGSTLSGGLDSPQIAIRALAALPQGKKLPTFTFPSRRRFRRARTSLDDG